MHVPAGSHAERRQRLEARLLAAQALWRPQPFKQETPAWAARHAAFAERLMRLEEGEVERIEADPAALIGLVSGPWPELAGLAACIDLPVLDAIEPDGIAAHHVRDIPGRKHGQIRHFIAAVGSPRAPLLEWCAGKGHLGRALAHRHGLGVVSLEIDAGLCRSGARLAERNRIGALQHFVAADALAPDSGRWCQGRHAIALHACGELHRQLIRQVVEADGPALDLAPCCYYRGVDSAYVPFLPSALKLTPDDLRLAVTQTATASSAQRRQSHRAQAWKLAWVSLAAALRGTPAWQPFRPIPESWYAQGFAAFIARLAEREGLILPAALDLAASEAEGWRRAARMRRLGLVRHAFRRPLELWLAHDMAAYLESRGYRAELTEFCPAALTPRNLLISARRVR